MAAQPAGVRAAVVLLLGLGTLALSSCAAGAGRAERTPPRRSPEPAGAPAADRADGRSSSLPALAAASVNGGGQENGAPQDEDEAFDKILEEVAKEPGEEPVEEPPAEEPPAEEEPAAEEPAPSVKPAARPAPPVRPRAAPPPRQNGARRAASGRPRTPEDAGDIFGELGLSREARREEAKNLLRQAETAMLDQDLLRAERLLDEARLLDPQNEEVENMYAQVELLLGNPPNAIRELAASISAEEKVRREQAKTEIERLLNQGYRFKEDGEYDRAVESFERAIESIRRFPFDLDLDPQLKEAELGLAEAKEKQKEKEETERQEFLRMLRDQQRAEEASSLKYLENQVRELRRKAAAAEEHERFDRAIVLYERILTLNPDDEDAKARLATARKKQHVYRSQELLQRAIDHYEVAIVSLEESSVVYQQIFRYPDAKEWARVAAEVPDIAQEVAATETVQEKEIKRVLAQRRDIGFEEAVPFPEALRTLQEISGINFVLSKDGAAGVEGKEVKLPRYSDLPLENYLRLILNLAGEDFGYVIKEGAVVIGPKASLKQREYLYFYEVSDLIHSRPDFKSPPVALDELAGKAATGAPLQIDIGGDEQPKGGFEGDKLLELIKKELGDGEEAAEETGISLHGGKLNVRTTLEKHLKLVKLLEQFRKYTGMMVTVESRFLDIQDNFLEEIGIDMGSTGTTFLPNSIPDIDGAGKSLAPGFEYVNPQGDYNARVASIGNLSQPLGSRVNPFNLQSTGGGAYQLNILEVERYQLEAILTGVAKEQEIRRLNSPRVTAFNGQSSHTLVVNQAAYIQDLEVNQTGVIPVINPVIGIVNSGSILEVRPTISHDRKYVVLEVQPTLAERLTPDVAILNLSGNFTVVPVELPVLAVTKIKTTVTVPDGGTVVVGGLKREITTEGSIGIPGLRYIPLLNYLSGRKGNSTLRSNLFVLLNAKITIVHEEEARLFGT